MKKILALILGMFLIFSVTVGVLAADDDALFEGYTCTCGCMSPLVECSCGIAEEMKEKIRNEKSG